MDYEWMASLKETLDDCRPALLQAERDLWAHPQTGFKEWYANNYLKERFLKMGFTLREAGDIPGFYFDIDTGREGPTVCVMGELDSIICPEHPESDPVTGAVHSCGHHCQSSALLGIAALLKNPDVLAKLSGRIRIMSVPAEELLEIGERIRLREEGRISYLGGKVEFIKRGFFDGVDMAMLVHTSAGTEAGVFMNKGANGCIVKNITYIGKAAHAAAASEGINALYAAETGITAANALRETFPDNQHIRFHPIVTDGGSMVNAIPSKVVLESYVRAASFDTMCAVNKKVNRALAAGALALGARLVINDLPGYMPLNNESNMMDVFEEVSTAVFGKEHVVRNTSWDCGSTDVGDVSCIMPAISPCCTGAVGHGHGADYYIVNPESAVVQSALVQAAAVCALLENNAEKARFIKSNARPLFPSAKAFLDAIDAISLNSEAIDYTEDGQAVVRWTK